MFICTYIYMTTWVHTAEVTAKRIRELYLKAILRQDIAFFDKVGAGEVTTRIQTDTRTQFVPFQSHIEVLTADTAHAPRFGPTRLVRKGPSRSGLHLRICYRLRLGVCEKLATSPGHEFHPTLHCHYGRTHEQIHDQIFTVSLLLNILIYYKFILIQALTQVCCRRRIPCRGNRVYNPHRSSFRHPECACDLIRWCHPEDLLCGLPSCSLTGHWFILFFLFHVCCLWPR